MMERNIGVDAEGGELILKNTAGDHVIIPKKHRLEVLGMIEDGCHGCIDNLVDTLPVLENYADDGTVVPNWWDNVKKSVTDMADHLPAPFINVKASFNKYKETDKSILTPVADKKYTKEDVAKIIENPDKVTESEKINLKDKVITDAKGNLIKVTPLKTVEVTGERPYFNEKDDDSTVKSKQEFLLKNNYYQDKLIGVKDKNNKTEIQQIQKNLSEKGYDVSASIKKDGSFDGILGDKTLEAIDKYNKDLYKKEVDGIVGERTKAATTAYRNAELYDLNYFGDIQSIDKDIEKELTNTPFKDPVDINPKAINTIKHYENFYKVDPKKLEYKGNQILAGKEQCAKHVRLKLAVYGQNVPAGDSAWRMLKYLPDNYETSFMLFDEKPKLSVVNSTNIRKAIGDKYSEITPEQREIIKNAAPLSVINLFNPTSNKQVQAYKEGNRSIGTHLGFVVEINGRKMVEHEIKGKLLYEPLDKIADGSSKYKAVYIKENTDYKPKNVKVSEDYYGEALTLEEGLKTTNHLGSVEANITYAKAKDYASQAKEVLNLSESNAKNLSRATLLVLNQESLLNPKLLNELETGVRGLEVDIWKTLTGEERSIGYGRMKDEQNFSEDFRSKNNINDDTLIDRSQAGLNTAIKAAQTKLIKNYKMLADVADSEKLNISNKELWKLAIKGYNFDIDGIAKTIAKYKKTTYAEIEAIYEKQAKDANKHYQTYYPAVNFETIKFE